MNLVPIVFSFSFLREMCLFPLPLVLLYICGRACFGAHSSKGGEMMFLVMYLMEKAV